MVDLSNEELKEYLDEKVEQYNNKGFIESDPIQIPHKYDSKEDIEIAGFLAATIAWGKRPMIIRNAERMMDLMGNSPYDYVMHAEEHQLERLAPFVHRTFNGIDLRTFVLALRNIYANYDGIEGVFTTYQEEDSLQLAISKFKELFFEVPHEGRTLKHVSDPLKGSAAKRINMYLRWMVRNDKKGVDFGLWQKVLPSKLSCPLDVHSGNVARSLGLLTRKQNDAKALFELDTALRGLDRDDPVKYDFALFGIGVFEGGV